MPAEAGIQAVGEKNNFKDLDSRFRGNDDIFPIVTQSLIKGGWGGISGWRVFPGKACHFGCGFAALYYSVVRSLFFVVHFSEL